MDIDVSRIIDDSPLSSFQLRILLICATVIVLDGFDVQAITYVAPVLTGQLGISRAMLGPVFSAGLAGTMLGGFAFGPIADRLGRKTTLALCAILFGACSLATATSGSITALMVWRLLAGLGLGGATPTAVALVSEYCPGRSREALTMTMYCGFSVGAALGGFLSAAIIPAYGWQSVFLLGGALPIVITPLVLLLVPESIRFLIASGREAATVARVLARLGPSNLPALEGARFVMGEPNPRGFPVAELFTGGRALRTALVWLMFFANLIALYFMINWLPTLFNNSGLSVRSAVNASAMVQTGSIAGTLVLAALARRIRAFSLLGVGFLCGAGSIALLALVGASPGLGQALGFLAGFFVIGTQTGANAASAMLYPTSIRSTGIGWALGVGRCGSILGPLAGGVLVSWHWSPASIFLMASAPAALAGLCGFAIAAVAGAARRGA